MASLVSLSRSATPRWSHVSSIAPENPIRKEKTLSHRVRPGQQLSGTMLLQLRPLLDPGLQDVFAGFETTAGPLQDPEAVGLFHTDLNVGMASWDSQHLAFLQQNSPAMMLALIQPVLALALAHGLAEAAEVLEAFIWHRPADEKACPFQDHLELRQAVVGGVEDLVGLLAEGPKAGCEDLAEEGIHVRAHGYQFMFCCFSHDLGPSLHDLHRNGALGHKGQGHLGLGLVLAPAVIDPFFLLTEVSQPADVIDEGFCLCCGDTQALRPIALAQPVEDIEAFIGQMEILGHLLPGIQTSVRSRSLQNKFHSVHTVLLHNWTML